MLRVEQKKSGDIAKFHEIERKIMELKGIIVEEHKEIKRGKKRNVEEEVEVEPRMKRVRGKGKRKNKL